MARPQIIENTVAATARHRCSLNDPCPIPHDERSTAHVPRAFSAIRISPLRASFFLQAVRAKPAPDLLPSRPAPSLPPAVFAPRVVIKMGYFSVGLPQLTFSRPGETLKNQESEGKNPQKSGSFLSWGKSDRELKGADRFSIGRKKIRQRSKEKGMRRFYRWEENGESRRRDRG